MALNPSNSSNLEQLALKGLMQTINDKWKYILQQLFEMLSVSLDTGLELFSPLVNGPVNDGQFSLKSSETLTSGSVAASLLQLSQVACYALQHGAVVAIENTQLALNLYQAFYLDAINSQLNADAFCEKSFIAGVF